jgi:flagellar hook assembly protein FlgD
MKIEIFMVMMIQRKTNIYIYHFLKTRTDFYINKTDKAKFVICNTLGKKVKTLLDDELQAGKYSTTWNGKYGHGIKSSYISETKE